MPFTIERNDLAHMTVDAVVVAANEQLRITGGVGAAVAQVAGAERLQAACDAIGFCPTGSAVATPGFDLRARFVIHAVGPVWRDGSDAERELLSSSYREALACAVREGARSVALPLLSSGTYGCPAEISFALALGAVRAFLETHDVDIRIVLYNRAAVAAGLAAYGGIASFLDDRYVDERRWATHLERTREAARAPRSGPALSGAGFAAPPAAASAPPEQSRRRRPSVVDRLQELREAHARRKDEAKAEVDAAAAQVVEKELAAPCDTGAFPQIFMDAAPMPSLDEWLDEIDEPLSTTLL